MADRATRKKQITELRQSQIMKAAAEVFTRKGYSAATVPEIAQLAGMASGTIYLYYPTKRDLFIATIHEMVITPLVRIFENEKQMNFPDLLTGAIADRLSLMQQEAFPRLVSFIGEIQRDDELRAIYVEKMIKPFLKRMEDYYRERIDAGKFKRRDPEILVRLIGSTILGMIVLSVLEGDTSPFSHLSREKLAAEIRDFILFGVIGPAIKE